MSDKHKERLNRFNSLEFKTNAEEFEELLAARENAIYGGKEIDCALDIMEKLDEVRNLISLHGHTEASFTTTVDICGKFHKFGDIVKKM